MREILRLLSLMMGGGGARADTCRLYTLKQKNKKIIVGLSRAIGYNKRATSLQPG
jgi:hypothetical protein